MGSGLKQRQREEKALATVASLVGALVLARAVNDPKLSDDILRATRRRLGALIFQQVARDMQELAPAKPGCRFRLRSLSYGGQVARPGPGPLDLPLSRG